MWSPVHQDAPQKQATLYPLTLKSKWKMPYTLGTSSVLVSRYLDSSTSVHMARDWRINGFPRNESLRLWHTRCFSMQTKRYAKRFSACCHGAQGCQRDSGEDTVPKAQGKGLTRVNLSHVPAQCPSRVSVESMAESGLTVGIQMCDRAKKFASDEHDVEFTGDGRVCRCRSVRVLRSAPTLI